jgi:hypothetical protein
MLEVVPSADALDVARIALHQPGERFVGGKNVLRFRWRLGTRGQRVRSDCQRCSCGSAEFQNTPSRDWSVLRHSYTKIAHGRLRQPALVLRCAQLFLSCALIGIDHLAGLVFGRPQDRLFVALAELIEVVRLDVLELGQELSRFVPFTVLPNPISPTTVWNVWLCR